MGTETHFAVSIRSSDPALDALEYLASQCVSRPQIYQDVLVEIRHWPVMTERERRDAFERSLKRVGVACPWIRQKGRVLDAAEAMGLVV